MYLICKFFFAYSGDHDMVVPYVGTQEWIRSLHLSVDYNWRPWLVNAQVAGLVASIYQFIISLQFLIKFVLSFYKNKNNKIVTRKHIQRKRTLWHLRL